jgi:hypothetical protein
MIDWRIILANKIVYVYELDQSFIPLIILVIASLFAVKCPSFVVCQIIFSFLFFWLRSEYSAWHILLLQDTSDAEPLVVTTESSEQYKCLLPHFQEKEKVRLHFVHQYAF